MRWILGIQDFRIIFQHIKGTLNVAADVLIRDPDDHENFKKDKEIFMGSILASVLSEKLLKSLRDIGNLQFLEEKLNKIITKLMSGDAQVKRNLCSKK